MDKVKIRVLRDHGSDKFYTAGQVVERDKADAESLVRSGLAEKVEDAAPENKAKKSAPENKSR